MIRKGQKHVPFPNTGENLKMKIQKLFSINVTDFYIMDNNGIKNSDFIEKWIVIMNNFSVIFLSSVPRCIVTFCLL